MMHFTGAFGCDTEGLDQGVPANRGFLIAVSPPETRSAAVLTVKAN
jgi:hypothetical protein